MPQVDRHELAVLLNANAKRVSSRLRRLLERLLPQLQLYSARSLDEARRQVREALDAGYQRIVCGGGDGTVVQVLNLIREYIDEKNAQLHSAGAGVKQKFDQITWPKIGILKLGTGNGWAGEVGSRKALRDLRQLERDPDLPTQSYNLVEAEGRLFHFSGLGYDAAILNDYFAFKQRFGHGPLAFWFKSLGGYLTSIGLKTAPQHLFRRSPRVRVTCSGGEVYEVNHSRGARPLEVAPGDVLFDGPVNIIGAATTQSYGWGLRAFPFARQLPGFFNFRLVSAGVLEIISHVPSIWRGTYEAPSFRDFLAQDVTLEFDRPVPYQVGGDSMGYRERVRYQISPTSVDVYDLQPA